MNSLMEKNVSSRCSFKKTRLEIDPTTDLKGWMEVGDLLCACGKSIQFWLGDWLRFGERKFGEMYTQALERTNFSYQRLADVKYVADHVDFSLRNENLSFEHHKAVASLPSVEQKSWLTAADHEALSVRELRERSNPEKAKRPSTREACERAYEFLFDLQENEAVERKYRGELGHVLKSLEEVLR